MAHMYMTIGYCDCDRGFNLGFYAIVIRKAEECMFGVFLHYKCIYKGIAWLRAVKSRKEDLRQLVVKEGL